jgi:hypothetical protein
MSCLRSFHLATLLASIILSFAAPSRAGILELETKLHISPSQQLRDERSYEHLETERLHNPDVFDHRHPFLGRLLTDPTVFQLWLEKWEAHPFCFVHHYPSLWKVLDGEARYGGPPGAHLSPPAPPAVLPIGNTIDPPATPLLPNLPSDPPSLPGPPLAPSPPVAPNAVPEPASAFLFIGGMSVLLLTYSRIRFLQA